MGYPVWLEVVIAEELSLDLLHDVLGDVVLVDVLQLEHKVFLIHEFLGGVPPVLFELLGIFLLWGLFDLAIEHDTDSMEHHLHVVRRCVQDLDLVNMGRLDRI